jgi:LysM repeat protein
MVTVLRLAWVVVIPLIMGCAASGPTPKDYQVITQALQADARQAHQTITDLDIQQQALQHELGEARAAKARLEGDVLNAERRLLEARHLVELQREELILAADERRRLAQAARETQAQMETQLAESGRLRQQLAESQIERVRLETLEGAIARQANEMAAMKTAFQESLRAPVLNLIEDPRALRTSAMVTAATVSSDPPTRLSTIIKVRRGDSLWALARRFAVGVDDLKAANRLRSDLIVPGQELLIPEPTR